MDRLAESLITLVIGGLLGGLVKSLLDYRSQVFSQLWNKRLEAYEKLWRVMKQFPRWPRLDGVTYLNVYEMSIAMKDWYFDAGGILMSEKTRTLYGNLQDEINDGILKNKKIDSTEVTGEEYDRIQKLCSTVRSEITNDLLSRKKFI